MKFTKNYAGKVSRPTSDIMKSWSSLAATSKICA